MLEPYLKLEHRQIVESESRDPKIYSLPLILPYTLPYKI